MKIFNILFIFLLFCLNGCGQIVDAPWGFSSKEYNYSYNLGKEDIVIEKANDICNGKMWVEPSLGEEAFVYNLEQIDWDINFSSSPNTYQLYLQALNPIMYLTQAYYFTEKDEYLDYARLLIESWIEYKNTPGSDSNVYLWYDHGTAIRTDNLIFFLLAYTEAGKLDDSFHKTMVSLLQEHGAHLSSKKEYFANHNHGIYQDQALIYLAYFLNDNSKQKWLELAQERIIAQEDYAFTKEKVHVENSPGYQIGVVDLFYTTAQFLQNMNSKFGNELYEDAIESLEFMAWITKPNGVIAEVGDTNGVLNYGSVINTSSMKYNNQHYIYSQLKGNDGKQPLTNSFVYPLSGYYFGRTSWEKKDFEQATWTMFKAGYSSKTHKHADDISFMLYSKGHDIFVDTGWYNYMYGSKERDYFTSARAHNTVIVDGKTYSPTVENSDKTGFFEYKLDLPYDYILAYNNMYDEVEIDRHFYYLDNAIILYDDIVSEGEHTYSQLFHLSEYMQIEYQANNEVLLSIEDTDYKVRIRQFTDDVTLHVINGSDKNAEYGYISHYMNHLDTINTLKFDKQGSDTSYITVITIEDSTGNVKIDRLGETIHYDDIIYNDVESALTISLSKIIHIPLSKRERPNFEHIVVTCDKKQLVIDVNHNLEDGITSEFATSEMWNYAYYLINYDTGDIQKTDYSRSLKAVITANEEAVYLLKGYIKTTNGVQRVSKILGAYQYKNGQFEDVSKEYPYLNLKYIGHHMEKVSDKTFRFYVDYLYSWNSSIAFYVYKDGGGYAYYKKNDSDFLEFTFEEPGKYTILYYLSTSNGDNEFWNFEQIDITL